MKPFVNTLRRSLLWAVLPAALTFSFTSCSDDDDNSNNPAEARVMAYHAAPYAKAEVDVLVDGTKVDDIDYGDETDYATVAAGSHTVLVRQKASKADVATTSLQAAAGKRYSLFAYSASTTQTSILTLEDDYASPGSGNALVRFVNLGYNAPALTLTRQGAGATPLATSVAKLGNSSFVSVPAGDITFEVREATGTQATLLTEKKKLDAGKVYTVLAYGVYGNPAGAPGLALEIEDLN